MHLLADPMKRRIADPYAQCAELGGWDIYAVDGHYHKAACVDPKSENSKGELRAIATGHFFRMNLRTHHIRRSACSEIYHTRNLLHATGQICHTSLIQLPPLRISVKPS